MARYEARVEWRRKPADAFVDGRYGRGHVWRFDEGVAVPASASPLHVRAPYSEAAAVDPEEAFVAALSSCHMLFYLAFAARDGFVVDAYDDAAHGVMERDAEGRQAITRVVLEPRVTYAGSGPDAARETALHHEAHSACYLANSVRSVVETRLPDRA